MQERLCTQDESSAGIRMARVNLKKKKNQNRQTSSRAANCFDDWSPCLYVEVLNLILDKGARHNIK